MSNAIILDTETTGFDEPEAIEVAHIGLMSPLVPDITFEFHQLYQPNKDIEWKAMATHHIIPEDLVGMPATGSYELPAGTDYIIGHSIDYDHGVIGAPDVRRIDTLPLCRRLWPDPGHTQSAMMYRLLEPRDARTIVRGAHSALADVKMCRVILICILDKLRERGHQVNEWEDLWKLSEIARVPLTMPFGKHKDEPLTQVPDGYFRWLLGQPDVDPYLVKGINKEIRRRQAGELADNRATD